MSKRNWKKHKGIKIFFIDVDGCLTDSITYYSAKGEAMKGFNMKDGMGIKLLKDNNIVPVIITGEKSKIVTSRAKKLKLKEVHIGVKDKKKKIKEIVFKYKLWLDINVAYIGDDLNDFEAMKLVALPIAPADASSEIKEIAKKITKKKGGEGCVREAIDFILKMNKQTHK